MANKEAFIKGMAKVEAKPEVADKKVAFDKARATISVGEEFAKRGMVEFANLIKQNEKTAA